MKFFIFSFVLLLSFSAFAKKGGVKRISGYLYEETRAKSQVQPGRNISSVSVQKKDATNAEALEKNRRVEFEVLGARSK